MDIKQYLKSALILNTQIELKKQELQKWYDLSQNISVCLSDMPKSNSYNDKLSNIVANIVNIQQELADDIDKSLDMYINIKNLINSLDDYRQRAILEQRYLYGEKWEDISNNLHYSIRQIHRLHLIALSKLTYVTKWNCMSLS